MGRRHSSVIDFGYRTSILDTDHDTAGPIKVVVTTPASGSYWLAFDVSSAAVVNATITQDVTIGAAGTAMTFFSRNQQGDHPDDCECDVEEGGTYTGGTEILTKVELRGESDTHLIMKQSTSYLITVTSKADNNYTSLVVWVWEGEGSEV